MTPETESYNVVLLGAMNPLIHSAGWYKLVGILDDDEFDEAVSNQNTVCLPPFARVHTQDLVITCQSERWEVLTSRADKTDRLCDVTSQVFDKHLEQTPIRAYGFNFIYRYKLSGDAREAISNGLRGTRIDIDWNKLSDSEFSVSTEHDDYVESIKIQLAKAKSSVVVATNYHYAIKVSDPDTPGYFQLGKLIEKGYGSNRERSSQLSTKYINSLS